MYLLQPNSDDPRTGADGAPGLQRPGSGRGLPAGPRPACSSTTRPACSRRSGVCCDSYAVGAYYDTAGPLNERLLRLARESGEPASLMEALRSAGAMLSTVGSFEPARRHLEEGIALYESQAEVPEPFQFLQHPGLGCRSYAAWVLWYLGFPDRALAISSEALALGRELGHPYNLVFALAIAGLVRKLRRRARRRRRSPRRQMALSQEHGFAIPLASGRILHGGALVDQGSLDEGIAEMREGLAAFRATGAGAGLTMSLGLLAEAYLKARRPAEGLEILAEAFGQVERTGERFAEAELLRLEGGPAPRGGRRGGGEDASSAPCAGHGSRSRARSSCGAWRASRACAGTEDGTRRRGRARRGARALHGRGEHARPPGRRRPSTIARRVRPGRVRRRALPGGG